MNLKRSPDDASSGATVALTELYQNDDFQRTGISVSKTGRLFVSFPRWSDRHLSAVLEVMLWFRSTVPKRKLEPLESEAGDGKHSVRVRPKRGRRDVTHNAVSVLSSDGKLKQVVSDSRRQWPDTFTQGPDGAMYISASYKRFAALQRR